MDFLTQQGRKKIIEEMGSDYNLKRKNTSLRQYRCYKDNMDQYVQERLLQSFSYETFKMMPVTSSINLVKRITEQMASIYKNPPTRTFTNLSEEQTQTLNLIYKDLNFDSKMLRSNILFCLQNHTHLYFRLKKGRIEVKPLALHQIDVICDEENEEEAEAYLISNYNNKNVKVAPADYTQTSSTGFRGTSDSGYIQPNTLNSDDTKPENQRCTLWSNDYNFVFDGNGNIINQDLGIDNELGIMPIVEIVNEKDLEYFLDQGSSVTEFAIDYNVSISDLMFISRLQGFAQGAISGDKQVLDSMTNVLLGPAYIIKLPNSPVDNTPTKLEFISRNSDLAGSRQNIEFILSSFLTSRGIDPKVITGSGESTKYNSGFDRLLSMIEKFEASIMDYELFKNAETKCFNIIKAFVNTYSNTEFLDRKYWMTIPEETEIEVSFKQPQIVQSENEQIDVSTKKIDAGLMSKVEAIMDIRKVSREKAVEILEQINEDKALEMSMMKADESEDSKSMDDPTNEMIDEEDSNVDQYNE